MGYTHYWTQARNLTPAEWKVVSDDIRAILTYAQHECGIALANGMGKGGTSPVINSKTVMFNGVGDDAHETMLINRTIPKAKYDGDQNPSWDSCKTARKPYDSMRSRRRCSPRCSPSIHPARISRRPTCVPARCPTTPAMSFATASVTF